MPPKAAKSKEASAERPILGGTAQCWEVYSFQHAPYPSFLSHFPLIQTRNNELAFNLLLQTRSPLVQSLIVRKPSSSFTRRGSMIYTNTPTRESLSRNCFEGLSKEFSPIRLPI
ncbi:protein MICROTUBULE BINDING PROTEIN 2C isoform X2 [Gossypium hirsutum]|uniref:Protein MICROTUBULE BINDING PROTEIN 2C isoform X2 n=1 Tax=Gossypium hirsutum TaxID=3635 RepID=A0ABM3BCJ5_GOSHI|nr:protein MICROTUBULE BINDING PROTEIN 2C-like isoform X2 [Gossypium hirsutum]